MTFHIPKQFMRHGSAPAILSAALLCTTIATPALAQPDVLFRAAHSTATTSTGHQALEFLDKELREKTEGRVGLEIFPSSQLGGERESVENIQFGNVDLIFVSSAPVASFAPAFFAFDIPFLFDNREQAYEVLDGEIGQEILAGLESSGIVGLAYWENGFRQLTTANKEVRSPEDLAGMKMRTMENEVHIAAWREIGANPAPLAFNELFTALQQGTFDAQEGPINLFYDMKFNEVQKYIVKTNHIYSPWPLLANPEKLAALSDEDRAIFDQAVIDATAHQRQLAAEADTKAEAAMTEVTFVDLEPAQKEAFAAKVAPIVDLVREKAGADLVDRLLTATGKN
ncbi:C4-dicarboxylate ABC transporter substrate-binding protein [Paracoccus acridae]|uniref:C4-dicarboxylate ABC transporter substrate-binding protein n=1 Tax=Paracoccus acridae TaxID=1795310 RepID=A0ABQ1VML2_9RHOB|nr:TRAP transporter substrate-binding protein [Paracoccus acridae]GGF81663.1 C4-dicarboxylate ABC transporter substrate-binding protein [Paracoccus acridae]